MYGENAGVIRQELASLLRQHRIQQRIGGDGNHQVPVSTTSEERAEIGRLIQRYRFGILTWCEQAVVVGSAKIGPLLDNPRRVVTPDVELQRSLAKTIGETTATLPTSDELTTPHAFPLVESWRLGAKAAALGEHDFHGELARGRLDVEQSLTVVKDIGEIVRALVVLDRRYRDIPGWELLSSRQPLQRAAETCAFLTASDYSIDRRGWRPPLRTIDGPPRPGIAGVIQAEHNLLVHLNAFPNALNFRRILDSQRQLSLLASQRFSGDDPNLSRHWTERARVYDHICTKARNVAGLVGSGSRAAAEAGNAVDRLEQLPSDRPVSQQALRDLNTTFTAVDKRLSELFELGVTERLYFARTQAPQIVEVDGQMVRATQQRFIPITAATDAELVGLIRQQLRPVDKRPEHPERGAAGRHDLRAAMDHRPSPGNALGF